MSVEKFQGLYIPNVTPFCEGGELDKVSLERLAGHFAAMDGVAGLTSCARIGEGPVLSWEEKLEIFELEGNVARKNGKQHIATILPQSTAEAIAMIKELESLPVDGVMIFPPLLLAWGKVSGDLKVKFFKDICDNTNLPIVLFQVPVLSYWFDAPTVKRIAELDNVVAYKEASFNIQLYSETMRLLQKADSKMNVLTGNDRFVAESYILGAKGALIGVANLATEKWAELDRAGRTGDFRKAMALQEELMDLKELVFNEPIVEAVARIKLVLHDQGLIDSPAVRAPQMGISDEEKVKLLDSYKTLVD